MNGLGVALRFLCIFVSGVWEVLRVNIWLTEYSICELVGSVVLHSI